MVDPSNPPSGVVAPTGTFDNQSGATIRPWYVERRPPMWAIAETDLDALTLTTKVVNIAFALGSFCLGFAANIWVTYSGAEKLSPVGDFLLHRGTVVACVGAAVFFAGGIFIDSKRNDLWDKIKKESSVVMPSK